MSQQAQQIKEFWNSRYEKEQYVYGTSPNEFFKSAIDTLPVGKLFVPGAGEGRDGVYAASLGWNVICLDLSEAGKEKAIQLAESKNVKVEYLIEDINNVAFADDTFDAIALVFFHLPKQQYLKFINQAHKWLKPGGTVIAQLFTENQLNYHSGGPKDADLLINPIEWQKNAETLFSFRHFEITEVNLDEGSYHVGTGHVMNFIGAKL